MHHNDDSSLKPKAHHHADKFGSFWPRVGAFLIDELLVVIALIIIVILGGSWGADADYIVGYASMIIYHTIFLSVTGTTPGKKLFGLRVVEQKTEGKVSIGQAFIRSLSYILSSLLFGMGFLNVWFDKEKHRALHDHTAGTVVIRTKYNKPLAIVLSVLAGILVCVFIILASEDTGTTDDDYSINSGTRTIENDLNLNPDLFGSSGGTTIGSSGSPSNPQQLSDQLNINDELRAVVEIGCPIDGSEDEWNFGSGTIVDDSGIILTNNHVVEQTTTHYCSIGITNNISEEPTFMYYADTDFYAEDDSAYQIINPDLDVALLRIAGASEGFTLPSVFPVIDATGSSDQLDINDSIYVAGYPSYGGGTITFTEGVMSGRVGDDLIKTSAKIDSGNSGGAAFNSQGELIGIPTMISVGTAEGLGYIVGIDSVVHWLNQVLGG